MQVLVDSFACRRPLKLMNCATSDESVARVKPPMFFTSMILTKEALQDQLGKSKSLILWQFAFNYLFLL
jgi:hypothetical protein